LTKKEHSDNESKKITDINGLIIITTLINKIPPNLPFSKGGIKPLFGRRPIGPPSGA
jgi:hypothetical protein